MPSLPPPRTTELYYDGGWHPVSVRESDSVTITRGLTGKGTRAEPTAATMRLGNRRGEVSAHDPASPLYGKIGRNTPLRFSVHAGGPHLAFPSSGLTVVSTPDHSSLAVAGDLDVRVDIAPISWGNTAALVSRHRFAGSQVHYVFLVGQNRMLQLLWSPNGTTASQRYVTSTAPVPAYDGQRLVLRATLDINNGAGGCTARFFYARRLDSTLWMPIGDPVTLSGTTSIFDGTAPLDIGDSDLNVTPDGFASLGRFTGRVHGVQVYDGVTLKLDVRPEAQATAGASSFTDSGGRLWTLSGGVTLSNKSVRLEGEVPAWPPERHVSGADSTVAIAPAGIMRRLGIGKKPLDSAIRRYITAAGPIECWPLTDGSSATSGAALRGGSPIVVVPGSSYAWSGGTLADWVEPVLNIDGIGGRVVMLTPASNAATLRWSVDWSFSEVTAAVLASVAERGGGRAWNLQFDPVAKTVWLLTFSPTGGSLVDLKVPAAIYDDRPHHIRLTVFDGGSGWANADLYIDGVLAGSAAEPVVAQPPQSIEWLAIPSGSNCSLSMGYVTYWGTGEPPAAEVYRALVGYPGESAGARITRIATEQGVAVSLDGEAASTEPLDVQQRETFLDTLETASNSDLGYLLERRDSRSLLYRARHTLYTQFPAVTLDYDQGVISGDLRPVDDDRLTRNDITVKREGGSEAPAILEEGRMSVLDPPSGVGRYDESVTLSLAADGQATGQAWWRLHLGTYDGLRYPSITVDLANPRASALVADLLAADVGDILRLQHLPAEYGPGPVDLMIRGYTEEVGANVWRITYVCDPGAPWRVGIYDDPASGKCDASSSQLTGPLTATATSFSVTTSDGPAWITAPGEFPIPLIVGGEEMRATAISGSTSPQTFTVVRSVNGVVKPHAAATPVAVARPAVYAL
ncbi:hypothetical protein ACFYUJ_21185 [Streptomyces sp. NPDC004520]|uniref:hypothetical protein n=1 Tax=Streptomyces sp. NPDC004520 TaxID=3364702 RepID=UPI0036862ECC